MRDRRRAVAGRGVGPPPQLRRTPAAGRQRRAALRRAGDGGRRAALAGPAGAADLRPAGAGGVRADQDVDQPADRPAGGGADRRRDRGQPACRRRGRSRADPGAAGRAGSAPGAAARRSPTRAVLPAARAGAARAHAGRCCCSRRRAPRARDTSCGQAAAALGIPEARRRAGGGRRAGGLLARGAVLPPARQVGGLPRGHRSPAAPGPPRAGGRLRSRARRGSPRLAPCRRRRQARRRSRGRAGGGSGAGPEPRWLRRDGDPAGVRGAADARRADASRAEALRGPGPRARGDRRSSRCLAGRGHPGPGESAVGRAGHAAARQDPRHLRPCGRGCRRAGRCGRTTAAARPPRRKGRPALGPGVRRLRRMGLERPSPGRDRTDRAEPAATGRPTGLGPQPAAPGLHGTAHGRVRRRAARRCAVPSGPSSRTTWTPRSPSAASSWPPSPQPICSTTRQWSD